MKNLKSSLVLCAFLTSLPAVAVAETKTDHSMIDAGKVHEVCMNLTEGQKLQYNFKSAELMSFNIHYHEDEKVTFPIEEHLTDGDNSTFTAPSERGYCMMWTNPSDDAVELNVEYEIQ